MKSSQFLCKINHSDLIHVPKGLPERLPGLLRRHKLKHPTETESIQIEYLLFFTHLIFVKQKQRHIDESWNCFVPMSSEWTRKYLHKSEVFLTWLVKRGILESEPYKKGFRPNAFKFARNYGFEPYLLKHPRLIRKIEKMKMLMAEDIASDPVLSLIYEKSKGAMIQPSVVNWLSESTYSPHKNFAVTEAIFMTGKKSLVEGYYVKRGKRSGRIFTLFCNLPKKIRNEHMFIDGEPSAELDIKCSQFQFLYPFFKNRLDGHPSKAKRDDFQRELKSYAQCFQGGQIDFYETLSEVVAVDRDAVKLRAIKWLFSHYSPDPYRFYGDIAAAFHSRFPILFELIREFKSMEGNSLALELQKLESEAVIYDIAYRQLSKEGFSYLTIHDSILLPKSKLEYVKQTYWIPTLKRFGLPEFQNVKTENSENAYGIQESAA